MMGFHKRFHILAAAMCLALTGACSSGMGNLPSLDSISATEVKLAPGDKIRVSVQDLDAMSGDYIIDETGSVALPLINQVAAAGMTYTEMQSAIETKLAQQQVLNNPNVTVQPLELRPIYIMGEVRQPGEYAYRQGLTVFAAISMAGGYTYRAATDEVAVTRMVGDKPTTAVATENSVILPGDRIEVYERWF